jgi:uroporphyrinogen decarboxylase
MACGTSGSGLNDAVYFQMKERLGIVGDVEPFRHGHGDNYYDPRVLDALGTDFRHIWLRGSDKFQIEVADDGSFHNEWGVRIEKIDQFLEWTGHPLEHATIGDLASYAWPDPHDSKSRTDGLLEQAKQYTTENHYALCTRSPSRGMFDLAIQLRGFEKFLMDMAFDPPFAHQLLERIGDSVMAYYAVLLDEVGPYIDIVETQSDLAHQQATFISLEYFRKFLKPVRRRLNDLIREKAPQAKIYMHCCGAIEAFISDLIEIGIDVLNPIQPLARGMNTSALKEKYGDDVVFHGAIDLQIALAGPPERVDREVRQRLHDLGPGGGYILAPANVIQPDVSVDNILLLYELAGRYGKYPFDFDVSDLE